MRRFLVVCVGTALFTSGLGPVPLVQGAERRPPPTIARDVTVARGAAREARRDIALPIRTNMVYASWEGARGTLEITSRDLSGTWSDWKAVERSDIGPDPGEVVFDRVVTEPVWVGTADAVKVRVRGEGGDVRDVKLHLINTLGNASRRSVLGSIGGFFGSLLRAPAARKAEAAPAYPGVIWRSSWGANESWRREPPRYAPHLEMAFVHHTATENSYSASQVSAIIRGIYHSHVYGRGYDDIAYNFLIDRYGRIFEGRAGGITQPVIGGHTKGMNSRTTGIALIGTFDRSSPPAAMTAALEKLLAWKLDVHHVPPTGKVLMTSAGSDKFAPGTKVWMNRISGHRDAQATGCPGSRVYNALNTTRGRVSAMGLPKIYVTERPGLIVRPDGDGVAETFPLKAWFSPKVNWRVTFSDVTGVKKVFSGYSYSASLSWDGKDAAGLVGKTGLGSWKVEAWDTSNRKATAASGPVYLVAAHPDGTLLQSGNTRIFLENGLAKSVSGDVAKSWFRSGETVATGPKELSWYSPAVTALGWRDGTILRSPDGVYHFVAGGVRRAFESAAVFSALGYTDAAAIAVSAETLSAIPNGPDDITDTTVHPEGAVVYDPNDPNRVAWVISGGQRHSTRWVNVRKSWYRDAEVVPATEADLALPEDGTIALRQGTLFRTPDGRYWLASGGVRRFFADLTLLEAMGYRTSAALAVTYLEAGTLQAGQRIG